MRSGRRPGHGEEAARAGHRELIDVRAADPALLHDTVGSLAEWLQQLAPEKTIAPCRRARAEVVGQQNTFAHISATSPTSATRCRDGRDAASWLRAPLYARP